MNFYCNYSYPIDIAPNGIPLGTIPIVNRATSIVIGCRSQVGIRCIFQVTLMRCAWRIAYSLNPATDAVTISALHWAKFCNINNTFKRVVGILVNWRISTGVLTRIARAILVKIPVEICQFTRIPMARLKVSFSVGENFSQLNWPRKPHMGPDCDFFRRWSDSQNEGPQLRAPSWTPSIQYSCDVFEGFQERPFAHDPERDTRP